MWREGSGVKAISWGFSLFSYIHFLHVRFLHKNKKIDLHVSALSTCKQWKELWRVYFLENWWGVKVLCQVKSSNHGAKNVLWWQCFVDFHLGVKPCSLIFLAVFRSPPPMSPSHWNITCVNLPPSHRLVNWTIYKLLNSRYPLRHDFSVLREFTERSHCDLEKTAASACQKPSSLLDVTSPQFLDVFTKPSVKVVHFLSHFSSYSRKMIVELYVI